MHHLMEVRDDHATLVDRKPAGRGGRSAAVTPGAANSIDSGLPVTALDLLAGLVARDDSRFKFRLISKATLERRRKSSSGRLTSEEGDRLAQLAKVFSFALDIYKTPEKARDFLARAHPMLDGKDESPCKAMA